MAIHQVRNARYRKGINPIQANPLEDKSGYRGTWTGGKGRRNPSPPLEMPLKTRPFKHYPPTDVPPAAEDVDGGHEGPPARRPSKESKSSKH